MMHTAPLARRKGYGRGFRKWALWTLPPGALALVLATEVAAALLPYWSARTGGVASVLMWARAGAVVLMAIVYAETFDRVERLRRFLGEGRAHNNHQAVWIVAAMITTPPHVACLAVAVIYLHHLCALSRHQAVRPHRAVFTAATVVGGAWAGGELFDGFTAGSAASLRGALPVLACVLAAVVLFAVNTGLVAAVLRLTSDRRGRGLLPPADALWFEAGTLVLGIVTAVLILTAWWCTPVVLGGLVLLHRASLVTKLQLAATTDLKTGLLNAGAWHERARAAVESAAAQERRIAVIAIDLDHFKRVNDEHGHLMGDNVLRAVAGVLTREARASDLVGRFGGEEFFILVTGPSPAAHAVDLAARIRLGIASLDLPKGIQVTASLGITHEVPLHGNVDTLIADADEALYAAKAQGRDRVVAVLLA